MTAPDQNARSESVRGGGAPSSDDGSIEQAEALRGRVLRWRDNLVITRGSPVAGDALHGAALDFVIEQLTDLVGKSTAQNQAYLANDCESNKAGGLWYRRWHVAQTRVNELEALIENPPKHRFWGAGEADCPADIKAGNGELHTLRCKVCGQDNPRVEICTPPDNVEPWPGCFSDLQRRRVETLAKLGLMLSLMAGGEAAEVVGYDAAELYAEVLMALAIEDAEDPDIALEEARDHPEGDMILAALNNGGK